jgi:hypothetical protein
MNKMIGNFELSDDGKLTYTPTGEDCTDFIAPGTAGTGGVYVWFGALDRLDARVKPAQRRPRGGWSGTVRALAELYGLDAETVAQEFGHSVEAFEAGGITIGVGAPGRGLFGRRSRAANFKEGAKAAGMKELRNQLPVNLLR